MMLPVRLDREPDGDPPAWLAWLLRGTDPRTRAARALRVLHRDGVGRWARQSFANDWNTAAFLRLLCTASLMERLCAALVLGKYGDLRVADRIAGMLDDADAETRLAAAVALGHLGDGRALAPLVEALGREEAEVRYAAAAALAPLAAGAVPALGPLREILARERDRGVRHVCGRTITSIESAVRDDGSELVAASAPEGTGTEPEAASAPEGAGTELVWNARWPLRGDGDGLV